ncbi:uncharacterized protein LOC130962831 [Arachis stenosperma]|uniref:uncharacterized protein LOC130962831 n=1 Tax=Arachis stenosperma TaxID=217475 RepID=UPI0025AC4D05|nr:uncharacterized protein LOC130962831 [Arachis stenosperma]
MSQDITDLKAFKEEVTSNLQNQGAAIQKLENQIVYLSKQTPGPSVSHAAKAIAREECKAITLRSGKKLREISKETTEDEAKEDVGDKEQGPSFTPSATKEKEKEVLKPYTPKVPYPQRLMKSEKDGQFSRFLEIFKKLQINILAIIQHKLPQKLKDPGSFQIPCIIGEVMVEKALCDLGASINLMSLTMMKRMKIEEAKPTRMALQLADRTFKFPHGIVEDLLVKVGDFIFPADFVVLDMEEEAKASIILGRPFLATAGAIIDVQKGELTLRLHDEKLVFNVFKAMSYPSESLKECMRVDVVDIAVQEIFEETTKEVAEEEFTKDIEVSDIKAAETTMPSMSEKVKEEKGAPKPELKALPPNLKYAYLGSDESHPVIISSALSQEQEEELIKEFDIEIKDKKGVENKVADHLSRIPCEEGSPQSTHINECFPDEQLMIIHKTPWFADIANFKATGKDAYQKKKEGKSYGTAMVPLMEDTLQEKEQQLRCCSVDFIGPLSSKMQRN